MFPQVLDFGITFRGPLHIQNVDIMVELRVPIRAMTRDVKHHEQMLLAFAHLFAWMVLLPIVHRLGEICIHAVE